MLGGEIMERNNESRILSIVALVLGKETIQQILAYSVCLIMIVYWIAYMILSKKY